MIFAFVYLHWFNGLSCHFKWCKGFVVFDEIDISGMKVRLLFERFGRDCEDEFVWIW